MKYRYILIVLICFVFHKGLCQQNKQLIYDNLNRLQQVKINNVPVVTYSYDELGNRLSKVVISNGFTLSGTISYAKPSGALPLANMQLKLKAADGNIIQTVITSSTGTYQFTNIANGTYTIEPGTTLPWSNTAVTSYDLYLFQRHITGVSNLGSPYLQAGDVNKSQSTTSYDLYLVQNRIVGNTSSFTSGDWLFENSTVTISGANIIKNINSLMFGDANGSFNQQ